MTLGGGQFTGKSLQWHCGYQRLEQGRASRKPDEGVSVRFDVVVPSLGKHDRPSATGTDLLDVRDHLVMKLISPLRWHNDEDRGALLDDGYGAVLELASSKTLGMHIGDLLELESTLKGHWVTDVAPKEEHRFLFFRHHTSQLINRFDLVENFLNLARHLVELRHYAADFVSVLHATHLSQVEAQQIAGDHLGEEPLG